MTTLVKIQIIEEFKTTGQQICYELDPSMISAEQLSKLCQLVEESHVLEHEELHFGPVRGQHEVSIAIETSSSTHEIHACDTQLSGAEQKLVNFVLASARKLDDGEHSERQITGGI